MKNRYILDTSFLSALFLKTDKHHTQAVRIARLINTSFLYISSITYSEFLMLKQRGYSQTNLNDFINKLDVKVIYFNEVVFEHHKHNIFNLDLNLKTLDYIIVSTATISESTLISFDKQMLTQYKKAVEI